MLLVAVRAADASEQTRAATGAGTQHREVQPDEVSAPETSSVPASLSYGHVSRPAAPVEKQHKSHAAQRRKAAAHEKRVEQRREHRRHVRVERRREERKQHRHHKRHHRRHASETTPDAAIPAAQFQVASLNVLGASHTGGRGDKRRFASGATRMRYSVQLLRAHGVDVVGLQEFEITQFAAFKRDTGGAFATFPGPTMGHNPVRNSIAWRTDSWSLVAAHTQSIPYFHGHRVPMPYVLLQNSATGRKVWFMNIHNPATTKSHGNNQRWRNVATGIEIATVHRLQATGIPVIFTGDFNERSEAFCRITGATALHAANGGSTSGPCHLPANNGIDWIFGSPDVSFSGYVRQRQGLVNRATDHPLIVATARVGG